jgi:hypothetical protein
MRKLAKLAPLPQEHSPLDEVIADKPMESVLPIGITIYGKPDVSSRFTDIINAYDIWSHLGVVNLPQDEWMRIPLVNGWETKMPKNQVYRSGDADRALIDQTFDQLHADGKMDWRSIRKYAPSTGYGAIYSRFAVVTRSSGHRVAYRHRHRLQVHRQRQRCWPRL